MVLSVLLLIALLTPESFDSARLWVLCMALWMPSSVISVWSFRRRKWPIHSPLLATLTFAVILILPVLGAPWLDDLTTLPPVATFLTIWSIWVNVNLARFALHHLQAGRSND